MLEGPTGGLFETLHNAPVTAYFGFDYYAVPGGQVLGLLVGLAFSFGVSKALNSYRTRMSQREEATSRKGWVNALVWIFVGKKPEIVLMICWRGVLETQFELLVQLWLFLPWSCLLLLNVF